MNLDLEADLRAGGWDCHTHVFGPYADFPLADDRSYTPPEATQDDYVAHLARLGLKHGVLVHPSAYGEDDSLLRNALAAHPDWRGVIVKQRATRPELVELRELGVRAARFSQRSGAGANFAGSASFADLQAMAPDLANAGMHAELWTDCLTLDTLADSIGKLPIPVVIDHMGGFDVKAGVDAPGFRALLSLLESGQVWVKLCAYRNTLGGSLEQAQPFQEAMMAANPDRLVWGSDWPHLRVNPAPDAAELLATFRRWAGSDERVRAVLIDNPARLYA
jgi:predicted TIM-barrel fold metal-dependent hydrolase